MKSKTYLHTDSLSFEIERKCNELKARQELQLATLAKAVTSGRSPKRYGEIYNKIRQTSEFLEAIEQIRLRAKEQAERSRHFTVSTVFLQEAFKKLTADRDEQFNFVTGVDLPGNHIMTQMLDLQHLKRTMLGVTADPRDTHQLLIRLEMAGHRLLAHFHSHPGKGAGSTFPSGIDERFQNDLERGGHTALMAIFSRDGFIRFIRLKDQFALTVFGEGIERVEDNVYRLTAFA